MRYVPDLQGQFFCYVKPNPHGFLGELRDMVRWDMNVGEAIAFHVKNWNFEPDMNARKLHEFSHQPFGIGTIYEPELFRYRVQADPQTSFLKPQGYNGFMEGELIAITIQLVITDMLNKNPKTAIGWLPAIKQAVANAALDIGPIFRENDAYFWHKANNSDKAKSLFEAKYEGEFELNPPHIPNVKQYLGKENSHGEILRPYRAPSSAELQAIAIRMEPLLDFIFKNFENLNITTPSDAAEFLYSLKIRDLHVLIGGEEAANAYFKQCGVQMDAPHSMPRLAA